MWQSAITTRLCNCLGSTKGRPYDRGKSRLPYRSILLGDGERLAGKVTIACAADADFRLLSAHRLLDSSSARCWRIAGPTGAVEDIEADQWGRTISTNLNSQYCSDDAVPCVSGGLEYLGPGDQCGWERRVSVTFPGAVETSWTCSITASTSASAFSMPSVELASAFRRPSISSKASPWT